MVLGVVVVLSACAEFTPDGGTSIAETRKRGEIRLVKTDIDMERSAPAPFVIPVFDLSLQVPGPGDVRDVRVARKQSGLFDSLRCTTAAVMFWPVRR